jgi:hypothetical protein
VTTTEAPEAEAERQRTLKLGLLAAPGLAHELAEDLAIALPDALSARFPDADWSVTEEVEPRAAAGSGDVDLVGISRRRMLEEEWDLVICLTDLPLLQGHRPVTVQASVTHSVGLVSVPALGPVGLEHNVREAALRLVERLLGGSKHRHERGQGERARRHLLRRSSPFGYAREADEGTVRFVTATVGGSLRLLLGMVRANRPWRLVVGLSRALAAALGAAAFGLASTGVWHISDGMGWLRAVLLSLAGVLVTGVSLIVAHGLWEKLPEKAVRRERVVLINLATVVTVAIGVVTLYLALLAIILISAEAVIVHGVFAKELGHTVAFQDYLRLAMLVSMLATIGGALGSALESDQAVREAAYGYHGDD